MSPDLDQEPIPPVRVVIASATAGQIAELTGLQFGRHHVSGVAGFVGDFKQLAQFAAWASEVLGVADALLTFSTMEVLPHSYENGATTRWQYRFPGLEIY